jgi:hypothetical protein
MRDALLVVAAVFLIVCPYALVTLGVYLLAGMGWALISLGVLILLTVLVTVLVVQR